MPDYSIQIPKIETSSITPNPANINTPILVSVQVIEETLVLQPVWFYSGQIYSGEV